MKDFRFDFLSADIMMDKTLEQKIEVIMERVKLGSIVVLERGFAPEDEMKLIHATLNEINSKFTGIEVVSLEKSSGSTIREKLMSKIVPRSPLTLVGPSKTVKKIKKDPGSFSIWV